VTVALVFSLLASTTSAVPLSLTVDACVGVDAEEVRHLTATELLMDATDRSGLEVLVGCHQGVQKLRVLHTSRGLVGARVIELGDVENKDARHRELALAIAELVRRVPENPAPAAPIPAPPPLRPELQPPRAVDPLPKVSPQPPKVSGVREGWAAEVALAATFVHWTANQRFVGADLVARVSVAEPFLIELRAGGRKTIRATALSEGRIDASGFSAGLGLGCELVPELQAVGVVLGARIGADWLRYSIFDDGRVSYSSADAADVHALGTLTGSVGLWGNSRLVVELAAGGALHSVAIREEGQLVAGVRGAMLGGTVGLSARF
jgi:hypothetical protein